MKTPGEIKKCLGRCLDRWTPIHFESCESDCPYHSEGTLCKETLHLDVLTYIQRLEETISSLGHLNKTMYDEAKNGIQELESRLAQVERERDAALKDIANTCWSCGNAKPSQLSKFLYSCPHLKGKAGVRTQCEHWQWRGVCEENTKEDEP